MKKFTLFAAAVAVALGASAQGAVAPGIARVLEGGKIATLEYVALDEFTVADLESKGVKVQNIGPNDAGRQLFIWASGETLQAYEAGMPGVDDQTAGFLSMEVVTSARTNPPTPPCGTTKPTSTSLTAHPATMLPLLSPSQWPTALATAAVLPQNSPSVPISTTTVP